MHLNNLEFLIAAVGRVGKTLADDGVAHPEHKLLVFGVCNLGLIHPERVDAHTARIGEKVPERIGLRGPRLDGATVDEHHAVRRGLAPR